MSNKIESRSLGLPESFCSNTYNQEGNVHLILARTLSERGLGVWINPQAVDAHGKILPNHVAIQATEEGEKFFSALSKVPEIHTLIYAYQENLHPSQMKRCKWDDITKTKVRAFSYEQKAKLIESLARVYEQTGVEYEILSWGKDKYKTEGKQILGDLAPLTVQEIQALVKAEVDKVLPASK